jgi:hypothetical protein
VIELGRLEPREVDERIELSGRSLDEAERELIRRRSEGLPPLVDGLLTDQSKNFTLRRLLAPRSQLPMAGTTRTRDRQRCTATPP